MDNQRADGRSTWWIEGLECFSLIKNTDKLLAPPRPGDEFPALDGVRSLSMLWVLLGHTLLYNIASSAGYTNVKDLLPQDGSGFLARYDTHAKERCSMIMGFTVFCIKMFNACTTYQVHM